MDFKFKILIIDDDKITTEILSTGLPKEEYDLKVVKNGFLALSIFQSYNPTLVLIDLLLPEKDGFEICKKLRKISNVPIIVLTRSNEVCDKVLSFELGADDYIVKPFDLQELKARIKAILRRYVPQKYNQRQVTLEYLDVNLSNYSVCYRDDPIEMAPKELELLYLLASNPNQVFTREQLLNQIWGYEYIGDTRTVDVHIKRIREKLSSNDAWSIKTVWGIGYKFDMKQLSL